MRRDTREWNYVPDRGEAWVQQAGACQMADDLLDPAWLPGEFLLGVAGRLHREGHAAIQLHGRLRAGQDRGFGGRAPPGAEDIRAIIDADTGLLLELTSLFEGEPLSRRSLHDVILNEPLDQALFRFTPPPGTRVEDVQARQYRPPLNLRWRAALLATPATPCRHPRPLLATALADRLKIADCRRPPRHAKD